MRHRDAAATFGSRVRAVVVVGSRAGRGEGRARHVRRLLASGRSPKGTVRLRTKGGGGSLAPDDRARGDEGDDAPGYTISLEGASTSKGAGPAPSQSSERRIAFRKLVRRLSDLRLAIGEIAVIASLSALGTFLQQGEVPAYYEHMLSSQESLPSYLVGDAILLLGLDHVYSSPLYLGLCFLLTSSLIACSYTRQWPMVKVAKRWNFISKPSRILGLQNAFTLPEAGGLGASARLGVLLEDAGYETFRRRDGAFYAFKGLAGKFAPIGVHVSMVLVTVGASISVACGWQGSLFITEGEDLPLGSHLRPNSPLSRPLGLSDTRLRLDRFSIDYYPDGKVAQFYSDLTVVDAEGQEKLTKVISVNDPLRFGKVTAYQTDWAVAGIEVEVLPNFRKAQQGVAEDGSTEARVEGVEGVAGDGVAGAEPLTVSVPTVSLEGRLSVGGRIWGGVLPLFDGNDQRNVTLVARDLQNVGIYDQAGQFKGIVRPGSKREVDLGTHTVRIKSIQSSSGLELKSDPGVPIVYTGFAFLMLTTVLSYVSHSQVWACEDGETGALVVGGTTNRAKREFKNELITVTNKLCVRGDVTDK